jgi:hypothetical protein
MQFYEARSGLSSIKQFLVEPVSPRQFIAVLFGLTLLKLLIVPAFYDYDFPVREIGFGFGPAAQAVATTGTTKLCPPIFLELANLRCAVAERMPLTPYMFAGAMKLVGDSALRLAILKTVILDLLLLYFLSRWLAMVGADRFTLILIAMVFIGPQYMLHSFSPEYEEGFLIQLLAVFLIIQFAYVWGRENALVAWARLPAYVAVNAAICLLKSSMILVFAWSVVFLATFMRLRPAVRFAAACAMVLPLLLWAGYLKHMTGQFAVGTSLDGWNLLVGNNPAALSLYPRYSLDSALGDGPIELDGRWIDRFSVADLHKQLEHEPLIDEWRINDAYRNAAIAWAISHFGDELRLVARRLEIFFFEIRNTPIVPGSEPSTAVLIAGATWMAAMRIVLWSAIITAALAVWRGTNMRNAGICFLAFLALYAAPYLMAYAYERHVVPLVLPAAIFLASAWRLRPPAMRLNLETVREAG